MAKKVSEKDVRAGITAVTEKIFESALYLVSMNKENHNWISCVTALDPDVFKAHFGVPQSVWLKFISMQDDTWVGIIQLGFDINYSKQFEAFKSAYVEAQK